MAAPSLRPIDGFAIACNTAVFAFVAFCAIPPRLDRQSLGSAPVPAPAQPAQPLEQPAPTVPATEAPAAEAPAAEPPALKQLGKAFVERFDGDELGERWLASDGWNNGDWIDNDWRASQVSAGGGARITLEKAEAGASKLLKSGEFRTKGAYRYGYFEFRMKVPRGPGVFSGAFTYAHNEGRTKPNEIDIEIIGAATSQVELTYHQAGKATTKKVPLPFDAADGFHTYAFDWRPDSIAWYADGKLLHEASGGRVSKLTRPQNIFLSQLSSRALEEWVGPLDLEGGPWTFEIACVAYSPAKPAKPLCD